MNAQISIHIAENKSVAVQIFEIQSSRGMSLDLLEKVKALLMKKVYLVQKDSDSGNIELIQGYFAQIYQLEEKHLKMDFVVN